MTERWRFGAQDDASTEIMRIITFIAPPPPGQAKAGDIHSMQKYYAKTLAEQIQICKYYLRLEDYNYLKRLLLAVFSLGNAMT